MLIGSTRKMGTWRGTGASDSPVVDRLRHKPPVYRERLTHLVTQNEHGKPVVLPQQVGREPQGVPKELRVEDEGKSKGRSVMEWIGIEV
jgi:hypothetical protein